MSDGETSQSQRMSDSQLYKYGFLVVVMGVAAILTAFLVSLLRLTVSGDVATAASATFAAIGTLAGAYFGFHAGSAGKAGADQARQAAENDRHAEALKTQRLAALAAQNDPAKVDEILSQPPKASSEPPNA
jgi:hypothetical protein